MKQFYSDEKRKAKEFQEYTIVPFISSTSSFRQHINALWCFSSIILWIVGTSTLCSDIMAGPISWMFIYLYIRLFFMVRNHLLPGARASFHYNSFAAIHPPPWLKNEMLISSIVLFLFYSTSSSFPPTDCHQAVGQWQNGGVEVTAGDEWIGTSPGRQHVAWQEDINR